MSRIASYANQNQLTVDCSQFNALLGSDLLRDAAWFLAKNEDAERGTGHKTITPITIFHADWVPGFTTDEVSKYYNSVLLFKVEDVTDDPREVHKGLERA